MESVIGWILLLAPLIKPFFTRFIPWVGAKIGLGGKALIGAGGTVAAGEAIGSAVTKVGALGAIVTVLARIWSWLGKFPLWLKGLFEVGGILYFIRPFCTFLVGFARTPILLFIGLVTSAFFPTVIEKIFMIFGALALKIFLFIFKLGKKAFLGAVNSSDGGGQLDEFRDAILGSFDELPQPLIDVMGYLHLIEDLGMILATVTLLAVVSAFKVVYGGFFVKSGSPLV